MNYRMLIKLIVQLITVLFWSSVASFFGGLILFGFNLHQTVQRNGLLVKYKYLSTNANVPLVKQGGGRGVANGGEGREKTL